MKAIFIFCFVLLSFSNLFPQDNKLKTGLFTVNENESCTDTANFSKINYSYETICVDRKPILTDANFDSIKVNIDTTSYGIDYTLSIKLDSSTAKTFEHITEKLVGKKIAIIVNGKVVSIPVLRDPITTGRIAVFSDKETIVEIEKELNKKKE